MRARGVGSHETGVAGGREPPDMGAGNWTSRERNSPAVVAPVGTACLAGWYCSAYVSQRLRLIFLLQQPEWRFPVLRKPARKPWGQLAFSTFCCGSVMSSALGSVLSSSSEGQLRAMTIAWTSDLQPLPPPTTTQGASHTWLAPCSIWGQDRVWLCSSTCPTWLGTHSDLLTFVCFMKD